MIDIEIITTKKKLTKSLVNQMPQPKVFHIEWVHEYGGVLGHVDIGHKVIIMKGPHDYNALKMGKARVDIQWNTAVFPAVALHYVEYATDDFGTGNLMFRCASENDANHLCSALTALNNEAAKTHIYL